MSRQQRLYGILGLVALIVALGIGWFVRAPYAALQSIKVAAERRDVPELQRMIDFPALKSSLKILVMDSMGKQGESNSPGAGLARLFAGALLGPVVDAMVTPESIAMMFSGQLPNRLPGASPRSTSPGNDPQGNQEVVVTRTWEGLSSVRVNLRGSANLQDPGLTFLMRREGMSWRLSAIER